jgi:AhpD family alkylhydroperoxidase
VNGDIATLEYWRADAPAYGRLLSAKAALERSGLGPRLLALVYLRVSQINGCAFCIDLHRREAQLAGIDGSALATLDRWREGGDFSDGEKVALEWAEAVTALGKNGPDQSLRQAVMTLFPGADAVNLTLAISLMNALNRLSISFAREPE